MIWYVDDDNAIREIGVYALTSTGFDARGFSSGTEMLEELAKAEELPEMIILDIMMPGQDGNEILEIIRSNPRTEQIPIIMATAKGQEYDKVHSLDSGADDYLVKPFGVMEMVARVKSVLRRAQQPVRNAGTEEEVLTAGGIVLRTAQRRVTVDGEPVELTYKEFELLAYLMRNEGIAVTRERLLQRVWGEDYFGETRTIDVHIKTLRKKLGKEGALIKTVIHVGYKLEV